jgi:predicted DNA-binding protein (MmcQ/YjbR family)
LTGSVPDDEVEKLISQSDALVVEALPQRVRATL